VPRDWASFDVQNDPRSFVMPQPELVEARVDFAGLSDAASALLEEVVPCFRDVSA
jgi:hypothetical protein